MSTYRPGAVANGYVLQPNGSWVPLQPDLRKPSAVAVPTGPPPPMPPRTQPVLAESGGIAWGWPQAVIVAFLLAIGWVAFIISPVGSKASLGVPVFWILFLGLPLLADVAIVCALVKRRPGESTASLVLRITAWSIIGILGLAILFMMGASHTINHHSAPGQPQQFDPATMAGGYTGPPAVHLVDQWGRDVF